MPRALGHILTGDRLSGAQAAAWGIAYRDASAEEFDTALEQLTASLLAKDRKALASAKRLIRTGLSGSLESGLAAELEATLADLSGSGASADGIAAFIAKPTHDPG